MKTISLTDVNTVLSSLKSMAFDGFNLELATAIADIQDVLSNQDNITSLKDYGLNP